MMPHAALIQLGKVVAKSLASGHVNNGDSSVGEALVAYPDAVPDVLNNLGAATPARMPRIKITTTNSIENFEILTHWRLVEFAVRITNCAPIIDRCRLCVS